MCHEKGTGEKYIPFWQRKIKQLHKQTAKKLNDLKTRARSETNKRKSAQLEERIQQAEKIIRTLEADGSWGVHNFKYTEAMLRKANTIIAEDK